MSFTGSDWDTANNRHAEVALRESPPDIAGEPPEEQDEDPLSDDEWLDRVRAAYNSSTDWYNSAIRDQWERNWRAFNNQHRSSSKYFSEAFKHRSKLFRPKTRAAVRKGEAACATAFFATQDLVSIEPTNDADPQQLASARVNEELLNYRLDDKPIKWFMTVQGAYQDTQVAGVCCSYQYWAYEERVHLEPVPRVDQFGMRVMDADGNPDWIFEERVEVISDEPRCELIAPENIRIAPAADWLDPINSSPYVIRRIPMFVVDIKARMASQDSKTGQPQWRQLDDAQIQKGRDPDYNSTRQARNEYRRDAHQEESGAIRDHDVVWVHENIMRVDGEDWHFYTISTTHLLSDPQPLREVYWHGERPYVMGYSILESHKPYPSSKVQLVQDVQAEANEIANQRIDNVRFAMNPRVYYKTGSNVDVAALTRSYPGAPVGVGGQGAIREHIDIDRPPEVTGSAYHEQDRINLDFDELAGSFSSSSVQSNRRLNETVGGMNLLSESANVIQDYELRVFAETWVKPVLTQLVKLEQAYETDETVLQIAGQKAQLYERFNIAELTEDTLRQDLAVRVQVGIGNTDPAQKLQRFQAASETIGNIFGPAAQAKANFEEVVEEVFGILGYRDGKRFFLLDDDEDPRLAHLRHALEQLEQEKEIEQAKAEQRMAEQEAKAQIEREKLQARLQERQMQERGNLTRQQMSDDNAITREAMKLEGQINTETLKIALEIQRMLEDARRGDVERADTERRDQMDRAERQQDRQIQAQQQRAGQ